MTRHHAECQCGQLAVWSDADPDFVILCNCKACQKRTGAPFGAGMYFRKTDLTLSGKSTVWSRTAESGRAIDQHFCSACGTTLYWMLELRPDHIGVAYGAFDTPVPEPTRAIWTDQKHGWVRYPEVWPTYPKGSPS